MTQTTPSSADIVERLRYEACSCLNAYKARGRVDPACISCQTKDERTEAAEEIESLRAELAACKAESKKVTDEMVSRFLGWHLPKDFSPDCGVSFDGRGKDAMGYEKSWPVGTNLFSATQARAMLEHVLALDATAARTKGA